MSYRRPFANRNGISLFISNSSWSTVACSQQQGRSILCTTYTYFMFQASGFFSFWQGFLFIITFFLMKSCEILRMNWVTLSFIWPGNTTQRSKLDFLGGCSLQFCWKWFCLKDNHSLPTHYSLQVQRVCNDNEICAASLKSNDTPLMHYLTKFITDNRRL